MVDPVPAEEVKEEVKEEEKELSKEAKFNILRGWAQEKGVKGLNNIVFPSDFSEDFYEADKKFKVNGVAARRDIGHREAILGVPFDLIMSSKTFEEEEPELFHFIIRECPDLFAEDGGCLDYEQLRIAFFLMNEETKG